MAEPLGFQYYGVDVTGGYRVANAEKGKAVRFRKNRSAFCERAQVKQAGASTADKIGMWANSDYANLVQPNDGFKTRLIGPAEVIADRIRQYHEVGVDLILAAFLHYEDELPRFGETVIP